MNNISGNPRWSTFVNNFDANMIINSRKQQIFPCSPVIVYIIGLDANSFKSGFKIQGVPLLIVNTVRLILVPKPDLEDI